MFELLCSEIQEKTSNFCCVISHNVAKQIEAKLSFLIKSHLNIETNYTNIFLFQFFIRGMDADQVQSNSSIKLISALNYETTCTTIVLTVAPYFHSQSKTTLISKPRPHLMSNFYVASTEFAINRRKTWHKSMQLNSFYRQRPNRTLNAKRRCPLPTITEWNKALKNCQLHTTKVSWKTMALPSPPHD